MDTTGIRQKEIEEITNPIHTENMVGMAPINAFPLSVCLQYIYCDAMCIPDAIRNAIIGSPSHNIIRKNGIESFA